MPKIELNGARLYYEDIGPGPETFVFSHSFLLNCGHFRYQIEVLKDRYRCLAYDHRGQGRSEVTEDGYDMENLYADAVSFIGAHKCAPCHFVGLSMGGLIGMLIAVRRPDLLKSLIIMDTPPEVWKRIPSPLLKIMLLIPRLLGWRILSGMVMIFMFGKKFRRDPKRRAEASEWNECIKSNDLKSTLKTARAILSWDGVFEELHKIKAPTLVIVGGKDMGVSLSQAQKIVNQIPGTLLAAIPHAGHISSLEEPEAVNVAIKDFLSMI